MFSGTEINFPYYFYFGGGCCIQNLDRNALDQRVGIMGDLVFNMDLDSVGAGEACDRASSGCCYRGAEDHVLHSKT